MSRSLKSVLIVVALVALGCASYCPGQSAQPASAAQPEPTQGQGLEKSTEQSSEHSSEQSSGQRSRQGGTASSVAAVSDQTASGSVSGTVVDQSGAVVAGARVRLTGQDTAASQEMVSGADGKFYFANVAAGSFQLTVTSAGFAAQTSSGVLHAGENFVVNGPTLAVATAETDVEVGIPQVEVAEEQMKVEEKQRVLGIVPNFYVSYIPNAAPLNSKQKFKLAWRSVIDPFTIVFVGGVAGVEQAQNHFEAYGQGAQGYAKRFGADYGDTLTGTFIGGAILPSILKQDPRYFYKGTGSTRSRVLYALAMSVICKGDNRRWQANYSGILGSLAAGGISNLYYPPQDRDGAALTFENAALGIAGSAVSNLFQEFVVKKLTPKVPGSGTAKP
jgi:hypothetical protein